MSTGIIAVLRSHQVARVLSIAVALSLLSCCHRQVSWRVPAPVLSEPLIMDYRGESIQLSQAVSEGDSVLAGWQHHVTKSVTVVSSDGPRTGYIVRQGNAGDEPRGARGSHQVSPGHLADRELKSRVRDGECSRFPRQTDARGEVVRLGRPVRKTVDPRGRAGGVDQPPLRSGMSSRYSSHEFTTTSDIVFRNCCHAPCPCTSMKSARSG